MKQLKSDYALDVFLKYMTDAGLSKRTISRRMCDIQVFFMFLKNRNVKDVRDVNPEVITSFFKSLLTLVTARRKKPFSANSQTTLLATLKQFFRGLYVNELILENPFRKVDIRIKTEEKKRIIMTPGEMFEFLDSITLDQPLGLRDRTIFELMYSSGLRVSDAARINREDINLKEETILIRQGKGKKDRVIPVHKVALKFLKLFLIESRLKKGTLFYSTYKQARLSSSSINNRFIYWLKKAGLYRCNLSSHCIRHSTAVHLLAGGADLRYVQELLGHESIETTVLYTHELEDNLKKIYKTYHPRENKYFKEVDSEYMNRIEEFERLLKRRLADRALHRKNRKKYAASREAPKKRSRLR
jgi:site-specific recombinase XerD